MELRAFSTHAQVGQGIKTKILALLGGLKLTKAECPSIILVDALEGESMEVLPWIYKKEWNSWTLDMWLYHNFIFSFEISGALFIRFLV